MKPFHMVAVPHKDILEGRLTMDVFAADLWEVFQGRAPEDYQDPEIFFRKTYLTAGLKNLLAVASKRLRGNGGDPVIQLQTPFGGGKTHALIALFHACKNPEKIPDYAQPTPAKVSVIVGTAFDPRETTFWEEIERQLEGEVKNFSGRIPPGKDKLRELLSKHQPLLILMDEVLLYITTAAGIKVGDSNLAAQTLAFMQELTEAAKTLDRTLVAITLPSSVLEHYDENAEKFFLQIQKIVGRMEKVYTPVEEPEIYEIIRRRLFREINEGEAKEIVNEFLEFYERENILPPTMEKSAYREKMLKSYPFHPEVIDALYRRWGSFPDFQRTRGVLRLLSLVIYSLRNSSIPLVRLSDFDLSFEELRRELIKHIGSEYDGVLAADITQPDSNARKVDKELGDAYRGLSLGTKVATAIFMYSFSIGERGATLNEIKLSSADPTVPTSVITEVVDRLKDTLFYLQEEGGKRFFTNQPNLNRILITHMADIDERILSSELRRLLEKYAGGAMSVYIWPANYKDVPDNENLKLVILQSRDEELCRKFIENCGELPRVYKNTLVFLVPSDFERDNFENWLRKKMAWQKILNDRTLKLTDSQRSEVVKAIKDSKRNERSQLRTYYRTVLLPDKGGVKEIDLGIPTYGEDKKLSEEVLERLKAEGEVLEKMAPLFISERYLTKNDYVETLNLWKSFLTTPGEPRASKGVVAQAIKEGVKSGLFGIGMLENGEPKCIKFKVVPEVYFSEKEIIVKKELCKEEEAPPSKVTTITPKPTPVTPTPPPIPKPPEKFYSEVHLSFRVPKGKFSDVYRGVIQPLERGFEETEIKIEIKAKKGGISKSEYEDTVKETLFQINAEIEEEKREERDG